MADFDTINTLVGIGALIFHCHHDLESHYVECCDYLAELEHSGEGISPEQMADAKDSVDTHLFKDVEKLENMLGITEEHLMDWGVLKKHLESVPGFLQN